MKWQETPFSLRSQEEVEEEAEEEEAERMLDGDRRRRKLDQDLEMEEGSSRATQPLLVADGGRHNYIHNDENNHDEVAKEKEYEWLLNRVGFGRFQILLLLVCGWANASDAVEILCVSFILPSAECELGLTPADKVGCVCIQK